MRGNKPTDIQRVHTRSEIGVLCSTVNNLQ